MKRATLILSALAFLAALVWLYLAFIPAPGPVPIF